MFEVMTLVRRDGTQVAGLGAADDAGSEAAVAVVPQRRALSPRTPDSLPRGPVSTALTLAGPTSVRPAGIVGILRFLSGVPRRYAFNVNTMDTSDLPGPARPLPFGGSSPTGQSTCPRRSALEPESAFSTPTLRTAATEPATRAATAATSGGSDRRTGRSPRLSPPQGRTSAEIRPSWPHRCAHGTWQAAP